MSVQRNNLVECWAGFAADLYWDSLIPFFQVLSFICFYLFFYFHDRPFIHICLEFLGINSKRDFIIRVVKSPGVKGIKWRYRWDHHFLMIYFTGCGNGVRGTDSQEFRIDAISEWDYTKKTREFLIFEKNSYVSILHDSYKTTRCTNLSICIVIIILNNMALSHYLVLAWWVLLLIISSNIRNSHNQLRS